MAGRGPSAVEVERFRAELERLAGGAPERIGAAVSGGPDSLALLLLASAAFPGRVDAATVDHGLRPEAAAEARFVAGLCEQLDVPHATLRPDGPIEGNLQSAARRARYFLLEAWRRARGIEWVLTGHHADDQAETLLMRLGRGAGVGGLAGVREANERVLRPLLGWRREELAAIVREAGIEAVDDPSNADERFDRARLRRRMREAEWIDPAAFARSAAALAEAEAALEWAAERLFEQRMRADPDGLRLDPTGLPAELRRRLLLRAMRRLEPAAAPRGEEVSRLLATLDGGGKATLAGIRCEGGGLWQFAPAPPRRSG